jgi:hypothetical protein
MESVVHVVAEMKMSVPSLVGAFEIVPEVMLVVSLQLFKGYYVCRFTWLVFGSDNGWKDIK